MRAALEPQRCATPGDCPLTHDLGFWLGCAASLPGTSTQVHCHQGWMKWGRKPGTLRPCLCVCPPLQGCPTMGQWLSTSVWCWGFCQAGEVATCLIRGLSWHRPTYPLMRDDAVSFPSRLFTPSLWGMVCSRAAGTPYPVSVPTWTHSAVNKTGAEHLKITCDFLAEWVDMLFPAWKSSSAAVEASSTCGSRLGRKCKPQVNRSGEVKWVGLLVRGCSLFPVPQVRSGCPEQLRVTSYQSPTRSCASLTAQLLISCIARGR